MMKHRRIITWLFACVPLIITFFVLPLLPDEIPAHYGYNGNVTRYGSKYEMLLLPVVTVAMGFFWLLMERIALKDKEKGAQNAIVLFWGNIVMTLTFTVLTIWFLYLSYTQAQNINQSGFDFMKLLSILLSMAWIIIGNYLPKCKQNALIGIRTKWTLADEAVWFKTHRFGGRLVFITGIASGLLCLLLFDGAASLIVSLGSFIIIVIPIVIYSYRAYQANPR